jgi:hypothetical protein
LWPIRTHPDEEAVAGVAKQLASWEAHFHALLASWSDIMISGKRSQIITQGGVPLMKSVFLLNANGRGHFN